MLLMASFCSALNLSAASFSAMVAFLNTVGWLTTTCGNGTGNTLALEQVWAFIFAPLAGAALAAAIFKGFKSFYGSEA